MYSATRAKPAVLIGGRHLFCLCVAAGRPTRRTTDRRPAAATRARQALQPKSRQRRSLQRIAVLADTQVPVLINGETGWAKNFSPAPFIFQAAAPMRLLLR